MNLQEHELHSDSALQHQPQETCVVCRLTIWGLGINLFLSAVKFVVGVIASSQALVADAVHSLSDMVSDIAILVGVRYWSAPPDETHPHGHGRLETLVSAFIGLLLAGVGVGLAYRAIVSIDAEESPMQGLPTLGAAIISILLKEYLYRWTMRVGKREKSLALIANAWHHRSDAFSSIPVVVAAIGMALWPALSFLDHVAAVVVSALIFQAAWSILAPAFRQLMDAGVEEKTLEQILHTAKTTEGVKAVHALRTRRIGSGIQVDLHVQVNGTLTVAAGHTIAGVVKERILQNVEDVIDVLVHLEPYKPTESNFAE